MNDPDHRTAEFKRDGGVSRYKRIKMARDLARQNADNLHAENLRLLRENFELRSRLKDK